MQRRLVRVGVDRFKQGIPGLVEQLLGHQQICPEHRQRGFGAPCMVPSSAKRSLTACASKPPSNVKVVLLTATPFFSIDQ